MKQSDLTPKEKSDLIRLSPKISRISDNQIVKLGDRYFKIRELG